MKSMPKNYPFTQDECKGFCKMNEMFHFNVNISGPKGRINFIRLLAESSGSKLSNGRRNIPIALLVKEI